MLESIKIKNFKSLEEEMHIVYIANQEKSQRDDPHTDEVDINAF